MHPRTHRVGGVVHPALALSVVVDIRLGGATCGVDLGRIDCVRFFRLLHAGPEPVPGFRKRARARQQPLGEHLDGEVARQLLGPFAAGNLLLYPGAKLLDRVREAALAPVEEQRHGLQEALGEALRSTQARVQLVDLALEPPHDNLLDALLLGPLQLARLRKSNGIEQLQQTGERTRVAVVRGRGEEQLVLEVGADRSQHLGQIAVVPVGRRCEVVRLVDDQQVPWQTRRGPSSPCRQVAKNSSRMSGCRR